MNKANFNYPANIHDNQPISTSKILALEAWKAYQKRHTEQMAHSFIESLKSTPLSATESILDWAESFSQHIPNTPEIPSKQKIPNIIHFCYALLPDAPFHLFHYLAIKSAYDLNNPDQIYFYYQHEPKGKWWDKAKPLLTLVQMKPPTEIFGNPLRHFAHQADVIRLAKLNEVGGIYLDMDTISIKPFTDLLNYDFVMGIQDSAKTNADDEFYGLSNAIMLGAKDSFFGTNWYSGYKTFRSLGRDKYWDEHSVRVPLELIKKYPESIKILGGDAFFFPLWDDIERVMFNEEMLPRFNELFKNSYSVHFWETFTMDLLTSIDENYVYSHNNIYSMLARKYLEDFYQKETISFVFLTYNRLEETKNSLESFVNILHRDDVLEMIFLDNASTDGTREYVQELASKHSKVRVILSDENLGVCHGRIALFREAKGDIIASLDSDLVLTNEPIIDKFKTVLRNDQIGMCGIAGAMMKNWQFGTHEDIQDEEFEGEVDLIAGCCQVFKRSLFDLGVALDPYFYPFWVEDSDLSLQVLNTGKKLYRISPNHGMYHDWGGSGKKWAHLFEEFWVYFANKWRGKGLVSFEKDEAYEFSQLLAKCQSLTKS